VLGQAQNPAALPPADVVSTLQQLGWIDITAISLLAVFFLLGLFKGFLWQVSRVAILVVAYAAAARLGQGLSEVLVGWTATGPGQPSADQRETAFYVACVLIFLGVLVVLSLLALLLQSLVRKAGMGFYDRLGGGVVGVATGGVVVLFLLTGVFMFFPNSNVALAAESSHSLRLSRQAMTTLDRVLPPELQRVLLPATAVDPAHGPGPAVPLPAGAGAGHQPPGAQPQPAPKEGPPTAAPAPASGTPSQPAARTPAQSTTKPPAKPAPAPPGGTPPRDPPKQAGGGP